MTKWRDCARVCVWESEKEKERERERPCHQCRVLSYINVSARQPEGLAADYFLSAHASNAASSCQGLFSRPPFLFPPFWDNNIVTAAEWSVAVWDGRWKTLPKDKKKGCSGRKLSSSFVTSHHNCNRTHLGYFTRSCLDVGQGGFGIWYQAQSGLRLRMVWVFYDTSDKSVLLKGYWSLIIEKKRVTKK